MKSDTIEYSAQFGDPSCDDVLNPHFMAIKKALEPYARKKYHPKLTCFAFILRGDGSIWQFNFEYCENIVYRPSDKYISIDIGIPIARWKGKSDKQIAQYLRECSLRGLDMMIAYLIKRRSPPPSDDIKQDLKAGLDVYVKQFA